MESASGAGVELTDGGEENALDPWERLTAAIHNTKSLVTYNFVLIKCLYPALLCFGLIGNCITLWVLRSKFYRNIFVSKITKAVMTVTI